MAKVMISLPDDLLERIDREARRRGSTRSGLIQEAARRELGVPDPEAFDAALARSRALFAELGPFDAAEVIRQERDRKDARDRGLV